MAIYSDIAKKIIEHQETIIGPIAIQQAEQVKGITLNWKDDHSVNVEGDDKHVIDALIEQYKDLFGQIAVEVSKDAVAKLISQLSDEDIPDLLQ